MALFDGVKAKVARVDDHLNDLDAALSGVDPRTRHVVVISREIPPTANVVNISERLPEEPARISLLVGEVLHQLRSALDHLIGRLEAANGRERESGFEFPIFWDRGRFKREGFQRFQGVSTGAADVIERCQPYHRPAPSYKDHPLWILHDLNNTDKHRVIIPTKAAITVDNLDINIAPGASKEIVLSVAPEHRFPVIGSTINPATGERWTLNATFERFGSVANHPIIPGLVQLRDVVRQIVAECIGLHP